MASFQALLETARHRWVGLWAELRGFLADPAEGESERAAFEEYTRELTVTLWQWLGLSICAAALFWWPLDRVVFADSPHTRQVYGVFRSLLITLDLGMLLLLPRIELLRRRAHATAVVTAMLNLMLTGFLLAEASSGSTLWFSYSFVVPQFTTLLLLPFKQRFVATGLCSTAAVAAWLAHPLSGLSHPGMPAALSFFVFCHLLANGAGHVFFVLLRRSFFLQRRLEAERMEIARLASRLELRVLEQTRELRRTHHRAQDIRSAQREELARNLHDDLGQELTSLRLLVGVSRSALRGHADVDLLDELSTGVERVQLSLRRVLLALRPALLDERGLVEALRVLVRELERRSGLSIELEISDALPEPIPAEHGLVLYHVAQEGLHNALRHARARIIRVGLALRGGALELTVFDDGVGVSAAALGSGMGTRGIRERAESLGGTAQWRTVEGTLLTVTIPFLESP